MHEATKRRWIALPVLAAVFIALMFILPEPESSGVGYIATSTPQDQAPQQPTPQPQADPVKHETPKPKPQPLSQHIVEYHIQVELDAEQKQLSGHQTLTWKHPGGKPVDELYFHLYPNAFQSKDTTFNRESGGKLRNDEMTEDSFGSMQLTSIQSAEGQDLIGLLEFVQPDDDNPNDQSLARLKLKEPVQPGTKITLHMAYKVDLPRVFARMGYAEDFVMAGQWFPKIAVYEPKGRRGVTEEGWNLHQYHGNSEFYADFGIYSVQIKVPEDYTVAATGFPTKPAAKSGGVKTYQFYADDVHDFAWAASPNFVYVEEPYATAKIPGVKIKLYLDPKHEALKERYLQAVKGSLDQYASWFGTYPYNTLSVVVPPEGANGAGGMEYPNLVTAWAADNETPGSELERVVVHEIGHQYFYGMIASNEFEEAWLDEGFTSYAEDKVMEAEYGIPPSLTLESSYITAPDALKKNAWEYANHEVYAENVYTRAKLVLYEIERTIGEDQMRKVMRTYFHQYKFKHPTTSDFQKVLEKVTKHSWSNFFDQFVYGAQMVDYAIRSIKTNQVQLDGETAYENRVVIESLDGLHSPATIRFFFADGTSTEKSWDGAKGVSELKFISRSPLEWALIDPQHDLVLENKHINNFMKAEVDDKQKARLNLGTSKLIEAFFQWFAW